MRHEFIVNDDCRDVDDPHGILTPRMQGSNLDDSCAQQSGR